jgi:hypothetical protein
VRTHHADGPTRSPRRTSPGGAAPHLVTTPRSVTRPGELAATARRHRPPRQRPPHPPARHPTRRRTATLCGAHPLTLPLTTAVRHPRSPVVIIPTGLLELRINRGRPHCKSSPLKASQSSTDSLSGTISYSAHFSGTCSGHNGGRLRAARGDETRMLLESMAKQVSEESRFPERTYVNALLKPHSTPWASQPYEWLARPDKEGRTVLVLQ